MRILRLLQYFPIPPTEAMRTRLNEVVGHILNKTEVTKVSEGGIDILVEDALGVRDCAPRACTLHNHAPTSPVAPRSPVRRRSL